MNKGNIPTISIQAQTLPEAWEKTVIEVWEQGASVKTEYDKIEDKDAINTFTKLNTFRTLKGRICYTKYLIDFFIDSCDYRLNKKHIKKRNSNWHTKLNII